MTDRKSNLELAKDFYTFHDFQFRQAIAAKKTEQRQFVFSADQFDDWAVAQGHMACTARDAPEAERNGVIDQRHVLRVRMNRAARKGEGLDRPYSVEARAAHWRVLLLERFVVEQPKEIVAGIRTCLARSDRAAAQCNKFLAAQENLTDEERLLCRMRLEMAQMSIFNGAQMMEMVIMGFDAEKAPNLKRLRRRMAAVLLQETTGAPKSRARGRRAKKPAA